MWANVAGLLVIGYLCLTRSFAYIGVPEYNLFLSEIVLAAFLLTKPRALLGRWFTGMLTPGLLSWFGWALLLFLVYGLFQFFRGLSLGYPLLTVLQTLAFHCYPLYFFAGLDAGWERAGFLPRLLRLAGWCNGIYGLLYVLFLSNVSLALPGAPQVPLLGQPGGSAAIIVALLAFERNLLKVWLPLVLNAFVLLALQVRAEWLAFLIGLLFWGVLMLRPWKMVVGLTVVVALLGLGHATDLVLPSPAKRGGQIAVGELVGRVLAPVNIDAAAKYTENARIYAGTFEWRTNWWKAIWYYVHEDPALALIGFGYGYPLTSLVSYLRDANLRTPHSVLFYALGYGGWLGVACFFLFQLSIARLMWRSYRLTGQPFGLIYWLMSLSSALFGNFFETPFAAIPFYLLAGMAAAPALQAKKKVHASVVGALPVPAAGR